jgi:hypothetical protein
MLQIEFQDKMSDLFFLDFRRMNFVMNRFSGILYSKRFRAFLIVLRSGSVRYFGIRLMRSGYIDMNQGCWSEFGSLMGAKKLWNASKCS